MARVLLLMTSQTYKARAFLAAARMLGCATSVGSDQPQVLAHLDPAAHLLLPFDDVRESVRLIHEHHDRYGLDAILATDDDGVGLAAVASLGLGLRGNSIQSVRTATDKHATRRALAAAGLPTPDFRLVRSIDAAAAAAAAIGYPCVVKPLHLSASRGVMRVDDAESLRRACQRLIAILAREPRRNGDLQWLVESYVHGDEFALEGVLRNGELHTLAVFDKPDPLHGPFFQETLYITPSRSSQAAQRDLAANVARATRALGLRHGPVHAEVRHASHGDTVLEVAPRSIGGRCSTALRFGPNGETSLEEVLLADALGDSDPPAREAQASGVLMIPIPEAGILQHIGGLESARAVPNITALEQTIPNGQAVQPPPEGARYLGFAFARASSAETVEQALRTAHACLHINIEAETSPVS